MSNLLENLASQIRSARNYRGMSLREVGFVAFGAENRSTQISEIEREIRNPQLDTLEKIFDALNYDLVLVPREKTKEIQSLLNK